MIVNCPFCGTSYDVDESQVGCKARCATCNEAFIIEAPAEKVNTEFDMECPHCGTEYQMEESDVGASVVCEN